MTTEDIPVVETFPTARPEGRPFDPPAELAALREHAPLTRMRYPDGHLGWLATGYQEVRAILPDRRFSSRYELRHFPEPLPAGLTELPSAPPGDLMGIDAPEHTRLRRPLTGYFTARRMHLLEERIEQIADDLLDELTATSAPTDLVESYAHPLPARVICELLGVPYADRDFIRTRSVLMTDLSAEVSAKFAAMGEMQAYLHELVVAKRAKPTDDVLSAMTESTLTDSEITALGWFLLGAGFDTTANMISLGTFALLEHPDQLAALRADPRGLRDSTVEELLRWLSIGHTNGRVALCDVEVAGRQISAGETITLAVQTANRDPREFADGDRLDVRRDGSSHLAFGHGPHLCLGAQLARIELTVALPALVTRLPDLRLAVDAAEIPCRVGAPVHGVDRLPVVW